MHTIDQYIDAACERARLTDRQLGKYLGKSHATVSHWRTKRTWPADETMIALAEVAGMDPEQALIDLNIWRSTGEARRVYERMAGHLAPAALCLAVILMGQAIFSTPATAYGPAPSRDAQHSIYYGNSQAIVKRLTSLYRLDNPVVPTNETLGILT